MKFLGILIPHLFCFFCVYPQSDSLKEAPADWRNASYKVIDPSGPTYNVKITDFKGKLTILDYWNKGCSSCLTAMPKIHELSKQFKSQLNVIAVTNDNLESVKQVFERLKGGNYEFKLPTIYEDTLFRSIFRFNSMPYVIWLDADNNFLASTSSAVVNSDIIKEVLSGKMDNLNRYAILDKEQFGKLQENLFKTNDYQKSENFFSINIGGYNRSLRAAEQMEPRTAGKYIYQTSNKTVYELLKMNLLDYKNPLDRIFFDDKINKRIMVSDRVRNKFMDYQQLAKLGVGMKRIVADEQNLFSTCFVSDKEIPLSKRKYMMLNALESYFDVKVHKEYREIKVIEITEIPNPNSKIKQIKDSLNESHVTSVGQLVKIFNSFYVDEPIMVIDDSLTEDAPTNLIFNNSLSFKEWRSTLIEAGFKIDLKKRKMEVIIIE